MPTSMTLATLFVWTVATVSPPLGEAGVPLGGLTVRLGAVRTWTSFDGKTPVVKADERWVSGAMRLVTFSDPFLGSSRLASGRRQMSQGEDSYVATLESFAKADVLSAEGRFCEVAVLLANPSTAPVMLSLADAAARTLDARLLLASGAPVPLRAFLVPGVGAADTSLVRSFEGKLAVALAPGEESWALLVFDVPAGQSQARLQLKKTATLPLRLP
jgi:hypothetical protein